MPAWVWEIGAILLLIVGNGVLAMSEIALITARRSGLAKREDEGDPRARGALHLKREPTHFLSTVQIGITLVGILAGALGGTRLARHLAPLFARIDWLAPYADTAALVAVVAAVTYVSLVIGELAPKRLALAAPERIASVMARPMEVLSRIAAPLVALLTASTRAVLAPFPIAAREHSDVSEEDIRAMIARATATGEVRETEQDILDRVFLVGDRRANAVMTARPDVEWVDVNAQPDDVRRQLANAQHARYLVCDGTLDRVVGVLYSRDMLGHCLRGEEPDLRNLVRQPLYVRETVPVLKLLEMFRRSDVGIAVALDIHGAPTGIVTLGDILEDLVADIPGPHPSADSIVQRSGNTWLVDGSATLDDVKNRLRLADRELVDGSGSTTLGGLVMSHLGRVPHIGERFQLGGLRFEVVDMDGPSIDRVLITKAATKDASEMPR
ncbi:MAG: hemolysin family protein [Gemmatimonadaceae bacterium]